jgi:hypothetical protein
VRDLLSEELTDRRAREVRLLEYMIKFPEQGNLNFRAELAHPSVDMRGGRRWKITRSVVSGGFGYRLEQRLTFRHGLPPVFF